MALNVQCGCAGKIEVVRTNSLTGEVTGVFQQSNIWTDAGLARISGSIDGASPARWPLYLHYGEGQRTAPHNNTTTLANRVGDRTWYATSGAGAGCYYPDANTMIMVGTNSIAIPARGVAWHLAEIGLSTSSGAFYTLDTYSLTKIDGVVAPIPVADIEILTITYTIQIQYPRSLGAQPLTQNDGLPAGTTWAISTWDESSEPFMDIRGSSAVGDGWKLRGFDGVTSYLPTKRVGGVAIWEATSSITDKPISIFRVGQSGSQISPRFQVTIDPPITKTNVQELALSPYWTFTNGTYREV